MDPIQDKQESMAGSSDDGNHNVDDMDDGQASGNDFGGISGTSFGGQDDTAGDTAGDSLLQTEEDGDEDDSQEIVPYCLICNNPRNGNQQQEQQKSNHYVSTVSSIPVKKSEIKEIVFVALGIEADEESMSPIVDPEYKLPLCSNCKHKVGQLHYISTQLAELEREFNRIRGAMAFTICDAVDNGYHLHEYNDQTDPLREARQTRQNEINIIQEFVHEEWSKTCLPNPAYELQPPEDNNNMFDNMRQTVGNLRLPERTTANIGPKRSAQAALPSKSPDRISKPSISLPPSMLIKGTAPTRRIRRTAASVQRERSEMIRQGIPIPNLSGGFRNKNAVGMTRHQKQFRPFNQNGGGLRTPQQQPMSSGSRMRHGKPIIAQQSTRAYNFNLAAQEDNVHSESFNESTNDSMNGLNEDYDGQLNDWNASQHDSDETATNYDQFGQFRDDTGHYLLGGGHFLEGGGRHFMEGGGYDDSEPSENMDDDGTNNDDIECHQNEEGLYVCTFCNKPFIHKYPYRDHLKTHTGEGPKCDVCGKIFPKNHNLMLHMRTHTGEKPFQCEICNKGFADKSNLKVHMRVHTGERPYQCRQCGLSFVNSSRLIVHQRLHTEENKSFSCDICQKAFGTIDQLQSHRKNHLASSTSNNSKRHVKPVNKLRIKPIIQQEQQPVNPVSSRSGRTIIPKRRI